SLLPADPTVSSTWYNATSSRSHAERGNEGVVAKLFLIEVSHGNGRLWPEAEFQGGGVFSRQRVVLGTDTPAHRRTVFGPVQRTDPGTNGDERRRRCPEPGDLHRNGQPLRGVDGAPCRGSRHRLRGDPGLARRPPGPGRFARGAKHGDGIALQ